MDFLFVVPSICQAWDLLSDVLWQPVLKKENYEFKPGKLCIKIDLELHPISAEGLMIYIYIYIYIYI